jgi:polar amino acid transport system substrate-binding protein
MRRFLLILALLAGHAAAGERPLRFTVSANWDMPMVRFDKGMATGGLLYDLQTRLAEMVGRSAEMVVLPPRRLAKSVETGETDVLCNVSPDWLEESHYQYVWSIPFLYHRDLLVARADLTSAPPLDILHGEHLGTVASYHYPELDRLIATGHVVRDDARNQRQVLLMVQAGRFRYAVTSEQELRWFNQTQPADRQLKVAAELSSEPLACIVRDEPDVPAMALLRAMVRMKQSGDLDRILARYL